MVGLSDVVLLFKPVPVDLELAVMLNGDVEDLKAQDVMKEV